MITPDDLYLWSAFVRVRGSYLIWAQVQNALVFAHVGATSRVGTPNIVGDAIRETLELQIRRLEQKQHTRKMRMERIGKLIVDDPSKPPNEYDPDE